MSTARTAMVLAAGLGTRMAPLTDALPKALVPLNGKPLIDHVLDRLALAGVERAVVNVHHMAGQIEAHLASRTSPAIGISDERDLLLDTGGGVARALPMLGAGPFFIHNSDSVWSEGPRPCLEQLAGAWRPEIMDTLLLLAPKSATLGYDGRGDFGMSADGAVARPDGGEEAAFAFTGVSLANSRLFEGAPEGKFSLNVLWDRAIAKGRAYGMRHEGVWMHVGTPGAVKQAEERMRREQG
ncbi:D-glycero-alpha-D-manno-heptose 1-phosphate guanylyltransferase [bacterium BMS3Bbin10]|nr:D-glycero-alpha-D-manno-heptose 1-phosphate guanylyltransferase [bacterium BMS3Bbin10]